MPELFFISDHHFNHANILRFAPGPSFQLIRPEFDNVEQMNEHMIEQHNKVVGPKDIVWFLGDVVWTHNPQDFLPRMNGVKNLTLGNHDKVEVLLPYFDEIVLWKKLRDYKIIISHMPIYHVDLEFDYKINVHGHIHEKDVVNCKGEIDHRYVNVGVEKLGYTPISIEELGVVY